MYTKSFGQLCEYVSTVHDIKLTDSSIPVRTINKMMLHWENCEPEQIDYLIEIHEIETIPEVTIYDVHNEVQNALNSMY